jgi:hypothetical protein
MLLILCPEGSFAQGGDIGYNSAPKPDEVDTNYIQTFPEHITGRFYLSQKYTNFEIVDDSNAVNILYEPNTTLNLGVGVTINSFTLNLAYGFDFLNPDQGQGRTRYLDLQSHIYSRKLVVDFFGQFYKGLYLDNTAELAPDFEDPYYVRPDIYEQVLGGSVQYVFNHRKYSYRSGLVQNERQLKSAGSFLLGVDAYYGLMLGDSALIPSFAKDLGFGEKKEIDRYTFFRAGPNIGYAHTFVVAKKFFAMLSLSVSVGFGSYSIRQPGEGIQQEQGISASAFGRFALGYNDEKWYLGLSVVDNSIDSNSSPSQVYATFGVGNVRLNYARRFLPGPKVRKVLDKLPIP